MTVSGETTLTYTIKTTIQFYREFREQYAVSHTRNEINASNESDFR